MIHKSEVSSTQSPSSFSRKSISVLASTATIRYSTPSAPWSKANKYDKPQVLQTLNEWELGNCKVEVHLACPYQFVVSELCQLSPQREVRVHQECLSTSLVEILEWQSCTEDKLWLQTALENGDIKAECECAPAYEGLSLFSSWNLTSSLKIPLQKEKQAVEFSPPNSSVHNERGQTQTEFRTEIRNEWIKSQQRQWLSKRNNIILNNKQPYSLWVYTLTIFLGFSVLVEKHLLCFHSWNKSFINSLKSYKSWSTSHNKIWLSSLYMQFFETGLGPSKTTGENTCWPSAVCTQTKSGSGWMIAIIYIYSQLDNNSCVVKITFLWFLKCL